MERKNGLLAPVKLKILFTIVDRKKCSFYLDILEGFEVNYQIVLYGRGTASSDILQLLGLSNDDKAVIMSFVKENYINTILNLYVILVNCFSHYHFFLLAQLLPNYFLLIPLF